MKKLLITTLLIPVAALANVEKVGGIEWHYDIKDGKACITKAKLSGDVTIPGKLGGRAVEIIGENAFEDCSSLTSIEIPSSVTAIWGSAFRDCSNLTAVKIPPSVNFIAMKAFSGCKSLTSVTIPNGVDVICKDAFSGCASLVSVKMPSSVDLIGENAFYGCESLASVTIPPKVERIKKGAFSGCKSLTSITLPASVTSIGYSDYDPSFMNCSSLTSINVAKENKTYCSIDGVLYSKNKNILCRCPEGKKTVEIPLGVMTISDFAFKGCKHLVRVTMPSSVTDIHKESFCGCQCLVSVKIPEGVTWIHERAFEGCASLAALTIPSSVRIIDDEAFSGCKSLIPVAIPPTVRTIGKGVFKDCKEEYKELCRIFGMDFGDAKPEHFRFSHYNIGNIPAYNFRPEKRFLDFDLYTVMYDDRNAAFFIRAQKQCSTLDEAMALVRKARAAIERKYGKMTAHNEVKAHADIHELFFDIEFDNHKTMRLGTAAGNVVSVIGFDPVAWDLTEKAKQENDDAL